MIERVARRICRHGILHLLGPWNEKRIDLHVDQYCPLYKADAAEIIADMGEPTEVMVAAGASADAVEIDTEDGATLYPARVWRAMIDAALAEGAGGGK